MSKDDDILEEEILDKIAYIARLHLRSDEKEKFKKSLKNIFSFIENLRSVPTDNIEPLLSPLSAPNFIGATGETENKREEGGDQKNQYQQKGEAFIQADLLFSNAPEPIDVFFSVPKMMP